MRQVSCEGIPTWKDAYATIPPGGQVTNLGSLYQCKPYPESGWCQLKDYEPGLDQYFPPPDWWPMAWTHVGTCGASGVEGNRLTVVFPPQPQALKNAGKAALTGVLRCPLTPGHDIAVQGTWGETLHIDKLSPCDYQLIMDPIEGYRPQKTPAIVNFAEANGQEITFELGYDPPFPIEKLAALPGLKVEVFALGLIQPRQMALGNNVLYVGSSAIPYYVGNYGDVAGFIYALSLDPSTHRPTGIHLVAVNEVEPHGVAYRANTLYYSTTGKLYRLADADRTYMDPHPTEVLSFPADDIKLPLPLEKNVSTFRRWHQKHPLYFDPTNPSDNKIYTAVGIPCNICAIRAKDDRYGSLIAYDLGVQGHPATLIAKGLRNSVGMDWNASDRSLWFSDNNRQTTGQADPVDYPEEINRTARDKVHEFGAPYVFGRSTSGFTEAELRKQTDPNAPTGLLTGVSLSDKPLGYVPPEHQAPALEMTPGTAPLGIKFIDHAAYPVTGDVQSQQLLVAVHGSGREEDPGADVRLMSISGDKVNAVWPFVTGWQQPGKLLGRPVDFLKMADGSLLVADDVANAIFRISYDPTGLPDTSVTFHMGVAPSAGVEHKLPHGVLIDAAGRRWPFQLNWSASTTLKGFAPGSYRVEMRDLDTYVAVNPTLQFDLAAATPKTVEIAYQERPAVTAPVTFKAPARPAGEGVPEQWTITIETDGQNRSVAIPWGQTAVEQLGYGTHKVYYPYTPKAIPFPSSDSIRVTSADAQTKETTYHVVDSIGRAMVSTEPGVSPGSGACKRCHQDGFRENAGIAQGWVAELAAHGEEPLRGMILSMSSRIDNGHCDSVCAAQIASYLYYEVWKDYTDPRPSYGARQLRKLTRTEYAQSVKDIFGVGVNVDLLPPDSPSKYFVYPGEAQQGILDRSLVRAYYDEAMRVAAGADLAKLGYTPGGDAAAFVRSLGHVVFRRALTDPEVTRYVALMQRTDDNMEGPRRLIAGMLVSPNFLYRSELGAQEGDLYRLTPDELATALSFGFLGTTPSKALLAEAESGGLDTPDKVKAKVGAMLATDAGQSQFLQFIRYYTRTTLPPEVKPGLDASLAAAMWEEQARFVKEVIKGSTATVRTLFNPNFTWLNKTLADHYGIANVTGTDFVRVSLTQTQYQKWGGLLQQGAFLASRAASDVQVTSLVRRGFAVRENLLCKTFGTLENDNAPVTYPDRPVGMREHWNLKTKDGPDGVRTCWACHRFVNDLGAAMEHYDQTAKYRDKENAVNPPYQSQLVDIDSNAPFLSNGGGQVWAHLSDLRGISEYLPKESQAMRCLADNYYRYLYGEYPGLDGARLINEVAKNLSDTGRLQDMLKQMAADDAMRLRKERVEPSARARSVPDARPASSRGAL